MKFTVARKDLLRALAHVVPVSDAKSTMPVLANVLLAVHPDKLHGCLTLSGSNLEITATMDEAVSVEEEGSICLPARALLDRVKAMPEGDLIIEVKGTEAKLKAKGAARKFTLHGIPAAEFPTMPELETPDWSHEMPALQLAELLEATSASISTDETRVHLNSLCIETIDDVMRCASTDGHRLSAMASGVMPARAPKEMLVPRGGVLRIKALIEGAESTVRLARCGKNLWVTCSDRHLCLKLAEGQFPPWQQVVPKTSDVTVELSRVALMNAVRAVSVSAPNSKGVKVELSRSKLKLTTESPDGGEGVDELDCKCELAGSRTYGVNGDYLVSALDAMSTESVLVKLVGELDPIVIEPVGAAREQLVVLMPMRI
jgi:DNA polymerase III subunit beta